MQYFIQGLNQHYNKLLSWVFGTVEGDSPAWMDKGLTNKNVFSSVTKSKEELTN